MYLHSNLLRELMCSIIHCTCTHNYAIIYQLKLTRRFRCCCKWCLTSDNAADCSLGPANLCRKCSGTRFRPLGSRSSRDGCSPRCSSDQLKLRSSGNCFMISYQREEAAVSSEHAYRLHSALQSLQADKYIRCRCRGPGRFRH